MKARCSFYGGSPVTVYTVVGVNPWAASLQDPPFELNGAFKHHMHASVWLSRCVHGSTQRQSWWERQLSAPRQTMAVAAHRLTQLQLSANGKTKELCLVMCSYWAQLFSRYYVRRRCSCSE